MKLRVLLALLTLPLLFTGCGDPEAQRRIEALEIQVRKLESEIRLLKHKDDFQIDMDDSANAIMEKVLKAINSSQAMDQILTEKVERHEAWIQAAEARASLTPRPLP